VSGARPGDGVAGAAALRYVIRFSGAAAAGPHHGLLRFNDLLAEPSR